MIETQQALPLADAMYLYAEENKGRETPLPDVVDAVAVLADTDTDAAKSAVFWLIGHGKASLTPAFMVRFPA